jgi:hypothetical protein
MTNKELIKILKGLDEELEVIVSDNCGGPSYQLSKVEVVDTKSGEKIEIT